MRMPAIVACLLLAAPVAAQTPPPAAASAASTQEEGSFHAELRREMETLRHDCSGFDLKTIGGCAVSLATGHPLHVSFGTLAPQNGIGFGPALVMHATPNENWKLNWSADIVGAISGAWRTGAYLKIIRTNVEAPGVVTGGSAPAPSNGGIHPYPVVDAYAQVISLPKVAYFGLGPDTLRRDKSFFGMRETIVGASTIYAIPGSGGFSALNLALLGEVNGRFVDVRGADERGAPSIEQLYTEATAPGLTKQPGVVQFGEGVRIKPSLANGRLQLNYVTRFQQFVASDSTSSFRRWTLDLGHQISIYKNSRPVTPRDTDTPNDCATNPGGTSCPSVSRNRTGTVNVRVLVARSAVSSGATVPFYFQPTLGGGDINGDRALGSYEDYRFRGPNVLLFSQSLEHSIGRLPIGLWLGSDQGRVSLLDDSGDVGTFRKSFAAGLTLRAGGFPAVLFSWSTGGPEGHHIAVTISTSVLGGSSRPSLY